MNLRQVVHQALGQWDTLSARGGGRGRGGKDACASACRTVRGRQVDPDGCNSCLLRSVKGDVSFASAGTCATQCSPTSGGKCACYTSNGSIISCTGCAQTRVSTVQSYGPSLYGCQR